MWEMGLQSALVDVYRTCVAHEKAGFQKWLWHLPGEMEGHIVDVAILDVDPVGVEPVGAEPSIP